MDDAVDGEVVGGEEGGERDVVAGGDEAEGVAGPHGVGRAAACCRWRCAAGGAGGQGEALAGVDDAVDGEVVGGEEGGERDVVAGGDEREGIAGPHRVGRPAGRRRCAGAGDGEPLAWEDHAGQAEVVGAHQGREPDPQSPGDATQGVAVLDDVDRVGAGGDGRYGDCGDGGEDGDEERADETCHIVRIGISSGELEASSPTQM